MCRSTAQGGQRCAAHTRPAYQQAVFGTANWDHAAAEHASTRTGEKEMQAEAERALANHDVERAAALHTAMKQGLNRRVANAATGSIVRAMGDDRGTTQGDGRAGNTRTTPRHRQPPAPAPAPSERAYTSADIRNAPMVATFAEGMTCGHARSTMVGQDGLGGWQPREVYACDTSGCTTPPFAINPMREAEASGFAPDDEDDGWDF